MIVQTSSKGGWLIKGFVGAVIIGVVMIQSTQSKYTKTKHPTATPPPNKKGERKGGG